MSIRINSRNLILKEVEKSDIDVLWKWRNEKSFQENCTMRKNETALEEFERELFHDFEIDRHIQCIAFRKQDMLPVGTIYSYTYNKRDGHCFVTTYITPSFQNRWYGPEIFVGFLDYLLRTFCLFKVYVDVYDFNMLSLRILAKAGFEVEGEFRGHRFFNGHRCNLIRMAFFEKNRYLLERFLRTFDIAY